MLGENSTVWGDPFYGLSAQIKLLCLFSSKQTFLNLRCSGSVRWFRSPVTCTHGFAHALCFFKVKTINNLLAKCFLCCTKTCLSEFLPSSEDFGFYSTWAELLLCMIRSSWVLFFFIIIFSFSLSPGDDISKGTEYFICFWEECIISNISRLLLQSSVIV